MGFLREKAKANIWLFSSFILPFLVSLYLLWQFELSTLARESEEFSRYRKGEVLVRLKKKIESLDSGKKAVSLSDLEKRTGSDQKLARVFNKYKVKRIEKIEQKNLEGEGARLLSRVYKLYFDEEELRKAVKKNFKEVEKFKDEARELDEARVMVSLLKKESEYVELAEPNYIYSIEEVIPNDVDFEKQWGLKNNDNLGNDISATYAWEKTTGSEDITVAVLDTGLDFNHQDFGLEKIWVNEDEIEGNGIDDDNNGYIDDVNGVNFLSLGSRPVDDHGHGTHVSGIIAAKTDNNLGMAGICWQGKIMPVKFLDNEGRGSVDSAILAVLYAVENGAEVINASFGGGQSELLKDAVNLALENNVVFVAAAGNSSSSDLSRIYPAGIEGVVTVGALSKGGAKTGFSNYGEFMEVIAPGEGIYSTFINGEYREWSGTSMAAPHVSGVAALIKAAGIGDRKEVVKRIILGTDDLGEEGWDSETGFGRINAYKAVEGKGEKTIALISNIREKRFYPDSWVAIRGFAAGRDFSHYKIEIGEGRGPDLWTTEGIRLSGNGREEVIEGIVGEFNKADLEEGIWTLKLTVYSNSGERKVYLARFEKRKEITIYVDDDNTSGVEDGTREYPYKRITSALENATDNIRIFVNPGIYEEIVAVYHDGIVLEGADKKSTIIKSPSQGMNSSPTVSVIEDDAGWLIENVEVKNFTIEAKSNEGVLIVGEAKNIKVKENVIRQTAGSNYNGVHLNFFCDSCWVEGNYIQGFRNGITASGTGNRNIKIRFNYIADNSYAGVNLGTSPSSGQAEVVDNVLVSNQILGIADWGYTNSKFYYNFFLGNGTGILEVETKNNYIYQNSFVENTEIDPRQVYISRSKVFWEDDFSHRGNYWSNFDEESEGAKDENEDGIIDTGYIINEENEDSSCYKNVIGRWQPKMPVLVSKVIIYPGETFMLRAVEGKSSFGERNSESKIFLNWLMPNQEEAEIISWENEVIVGELKEDILPGVYYVTIKTQRNTAPEFIGVVLAVVDEGDFILPFTPSVEPTPIPTAEITPTVEPTPEEAPTLTPTVSEKCFKKNGIRFCCIETEGKRTCWVVEVPPDKFYTVENRRGKEKMDQILKRLIKMKKEEKKLPFERLNRLISKIDALVY